jgi:ribosome biogenesis GTPase
MDPTRGLVIRAQSRSFIVRVGEAEFPALIPKKLRFRSRGVVDPVAVGDQVVLDLSSSQAVIEEVLPRRNALSRVALGGAGKRQLLAANIDLAVVVLAAVEPPWKPATLDRYLVLASFNSVPAIACMNKSDLAPELRTSEQLAIYARLAIPIVHVSAMTGEGMAELQEHLAERTAVFLGPSGAGKSSLINRLVPDAGLRVGGLSVQTGKGSHTTTWVEMLDLPGGGHLVDSPGLRVLDLTGLDPSELADHFPELRELAPGCRFPDCRHLTEPDCAVRQGLAEGLVAPHRYDSYTRIHQSLCQGEG